MAELANLSYCGLMLATAQSGLSPLISKALSSQMIFFFFIADSH